VKRVVAIADLEINIGYFKVFHLSGTSSLVVGKSNYTNLNSKSKTNNGVGNAYGDGSNINMSPYKPIINDNDVMDTPGITEQGEVLNLGNTPATNYPLQDYQEDYYDSIYNTPENTLENKEGYPFNYPSHLINWEKE
jgi:hypothetical protein